MVLLRFRWQVLPDEDIMVEKLFAQYEDTLFPELGPSLGVEADGTIPVPSGHGLGFEVDAAALERLAINEGSSL